MNDREKRELDLYATIYALEHSEYGYYIEEYNKHYEAYKAGYCKALKKHYKRNNYDLCNN